MEEPSLDYNDMVMAQMAARLTAHEKALATLARYFTSGNHIPVDQATIKAADFWSITGLVPNAKVSGASDD